MFKKIKSLNNIVNLGLNVHKYYIPDSYDTYIKLLQTMQHCTIRTDRKHFSDDLPFYIVNMNNDDEYYIDGIWNHAQINGYKLIISDGIKYDNIQEYNMTVKISKNGDFIFEASELKMPLRHMYRHPLLSCYGSITDEISQWEIINQKYGIYKKDIKKDLELLYTYGIHDKWLEVTKYPRGVGILDESIVFWEIR